jgi:murein DD-endopeptidase MepM/ murein hydrolase activator NlpD
LSLDLDGKSPGTINLAQPNDPVPGNSSQVQKPVHSGTYKAQYPYVAPGPLSGKSWTWFATGNIKGSIAAGVNIYGTTGGDVVAPAAGTVVKTATSSGPGVRIAAGGNLYVEITHMQTVNVRPGQTVARGQVIGTMRASSGNSAYAHAQVFNGSTQIDPTDYFPVVP